MATPHPGNICPTSGKTQHASIEGARAEGRKHQDDTMVPYKCGFCSLWHTGHAERGRGRGKGRGMASHHGGRRR